jgi:D-xylose transport system substrate-binding protein
MKRQAIRLLAGLMTVALAACGGGGGEPRTATRQRPTTMKIGFLLDDTHERWERDRDLFIERAKALGADVVVEVAGGDQEKQNAQADGLLEQGVRVLVVVPHDADGAASIVAKAQAKKVPVISYDRLIRNADEDLYVTFDNVKVGEMQAQYLITRAPKGNYIVLGGSETDSNAKQYREGQMKVLEPAVKSGAIKIVADPWTDWSAAQAERLTAAAMDKARNKVVAIVAANDVTAGGVVKVLEARGLAGKVLVSGQDAELEGVRRVVAGTQAMTVYKPIGALARLAARAAVQLANGEKVDAASVTPNGKKDVPTMLLDPIAVDKSNIETILIGDGFHKREDIYGKTSE